MVPAQAPATGRGASDSRRCCARHSPRVSAAVRSGTPVPLGKWLTEDLVLTAHRLSGGRRHRKASDLLASRRPRTGASSRRCVRGTQPVSRPVPDLVEPWPACSRNWSAAPPGGDLCAWAEASLLAEIAAAVPGNVRLAAALVGVTEATVLRRMASLRQF